MRPLTAIDGDSVAEQQMRRIERQVGVLERTTAELMAKGGFRLRRDILRPS